MKKTFIAAMIALLAIPSVAALAEEKEYRSDAVKQSSLDVDLWVDNEDGIYYEGESITVFFHANRDCFVAVYSLDTRGQVHLLYPVNPWDNGFVSGGETYAIPADYDDYELIVTGPEGIEHLQAVASIEEIDIPDWYDGSPLRSGDYYDDPEDFLGYVNDRYFQSRWENRDRVFDHTTIYVKSPRYYYKPVYVPNHWYDTPYYSMVYIDYPFGGEIYIDGIYFGIAPLWIPRVMIGWHWITIYDRYGYCWEDHIDFVHNTTIRLDRSRVKTSRTIVSRFKDVRTQSTKYNRSSYLLSDKKVSTSMIKDADMRTKRSEYRERTTTTTKTKRMEDSWNRKAPDTRKTDASRKSSGSDSWRTTPDRSGSGGGPRKSDGAYKTEGSRKPTDNAGSTKVSPDRSTRNQGDSKKAPDSKGSTSKGKDGGVSKSSGDSKPSSVGRSDSGRSSSGKSSSSSQSTKKGGGKK